LFIALTHAISVVADSRSRPETAGPFRPGPALTNAGPGRRSTPAGCGHQAGCASRSNSLRLDRPAWSTEPRFPGEFGCGHDCLLAAVLMTRPSSLPLQESQATRVPRGRIEPPKPPAAYLWATPS